MMAFKTERQVQRSVAISVGESNRTLRRRPRSWRLEFPRDGQAANGHNDCNKDKEAEPRNSASMTEREEDKDGQRARE